MTVLGDHHRAGSGEPLLLVHGFSATWKTWRPVIGALALEFEVLAPTLPGHAGGVPLQAPKTIAALGDRVEELLDEVGWHAPHVAGFSLGGWLALELAKRGRARSVTAFSPAGALLWCGPRERRRFQRQFKTNRALARAMTPVMDRVLGVPALRRVALRDSMVDGSRMEAPDAATALRDFVATPVFDEILAAFDREELVDLDRVSVPVTIWWGRRDRILPVKHAPYFEERLPDANFQYVDDAGHVPFWDAPDSVLQAIRETAAKADAPAGA